MNNYSQTFYENAIHLKFQFCEAQYGWRGAVCILGAVALNVAVCGVIFRQPNSTQRTVDEAPEQPSDSHTSKAVSKTSDKDNGLCKDLSMLKDAKFLCYCANNFLFCVGYATAMVHLPAYAQTLGIDENHRSIFFSMFGPASIVGKISFGLLGQIKGIRPSLIYTIFFFVIGVELLLAPLYLRSFTDFLIFSISFGLMISTFGATLPSIMVELYDVDSLSSAYGYLQLFDMVGFLLGPPVAGTLVSIQYNFETFLIVFFLSRQISDTLIGNTTIQKYFV